MTDSRFLYPWQKNDWRQLVNYIQQDRIPQALLMSGRQGIGKLHLAKQFAAALMCSQPDEVGLSCGQCQNCRLISANTHPDFLIIEPEEEGKRIVIDQIRTLLTKLTLKPQYDGFRVVIIRPADVINHFAANAFLKCLEEPNDRTLIILVTDQPSKLPITISSRCQKLVIQQPDKEIVLAWLRQQQSNNDSEILLALAQGAPLKANEYQQQNLLQIRNECFESWIKIANHQNNPVLIADKWCKLELSELLFWLTSWIIDLTKLKFNAPDHKFFNPDLIVQLEKLAKTLELEQLYKQYYLVINSRQRLHSQLNQQLILEELLIQWSISNGRN